MCGLAVCVFSVAMSAAQATVSSVAAASYLNSKCRGVCSHTSKRRGRKLEMTPEY